MSNDPLVGRQFGQYRIDSLLGRGGMGSVYRGFQPSLNRPVAIKILSANLAANPTYRERFLREAHTAAALEHPHIIHLYDYGTHEDMAFVVMQLLAGGALADHLEQRRAAHQPLPTPAEVADLVEKLAAALDYAHRKGVIHRDIKPNNILFDEHGQPYLVDFGIAKLLDQAATALTAEGGTLGTPTHMAPEQWRGQAVPASDQYALAVVIYQVLTNELPFQAPTPYALMAQHIETMPTPPHELRSDLPAAVSEVLERALAKDPTKRFPTLGALAAAFGAAAGAAVEVDAPPTLDVRPAGLAVTFVTPPTPLPTAPAARTGMVADDKTTLLTAPPAASRRGYWIGAALLVIVGVGVALLMVMRAQDADEDPALSAAARTATAAQSVALNQTATATHWTATPTPSPTPSPTSSHTPTPTPTPLEGEPAAAGQLLVVLADFEIIDADAISTERNIERALEEADVPFVRVRHPLAGRQQARTVSDLYNATMVIWGEVAAGGVRTFFEVTPRRSRVDFLVEDVSVSATEVESFEAYVFTGMDTLYVVYFTLGQIAYYEQSDVQALDYFNRAVDLLPAGREEEVGGSQLYLSRGIVQALLDDDAAAIADYSAALALDPTNAFAYGNRALSYYNSGDFAAALQDAAAALERDPTVVQFYHYSGLARAAQKDYAAAIADYTRALELDALYADGYVSRGASWGSLGEFEKALADFDRALELDPTNAIAVRNRGLARYNLGDRDGALADYERALELDPAHARAYNSRANLRKDDGDLEAALSDYNRALEFDPTLVDAYAGRVQLYRQQGQYRAALADYTTILELEPARDNTYYFRGLTYYDLGDYAAAIADFSAEIARDPTDSLAYQERARSYREVDDDAAALADLNRAIELNPTVDSFFLDRGFIHERLEDFTAALADYSEAIRLAPENTLNLDYRGDLYYQLGNNVRARADYTAIIELRPDDANAYIDRGLTYLAQNRLEEALADFTRGVELNPEAGFAYLVRGDAYFALSDYANALADYRRYLELDDTPAADVITRVADLERILSRPPTPTPAAITDARFPIGGEIQLPGAFMVMLKDRAGGVNDVTACTTAVKATVLEVVQLGAALWVKARCDGGEGWLPADDFE